MKSLYKKNEEGHFQLRDVELQHPLPPDNFLEENDIFASKCIKMKGNSNAFFGGYVRPIYEALNCLRKVCCMKWLNNL